MTLFSVARSIWWQRCRGLQLIRYGRWTSAWLSIFVAPPTNASKAPFATSINGLLTMSSIHISSKIDVTRTNVCILLHPSPWPPPSRPFEHTDEWHTSHVHPSMILSLSTVNLEASSLFIYLLLSIIGWTDGDGCASDVPCHHYMLLPGRCQFFHPMLSLDGWYMSSIYPPVLILRSTSFSESRESLHHTYLLTFIHGWMDWWIDVLHTSL